MAIDVTCPSCGKNGRVPDRVAGKAVRCPGCGARLVVGAPDPSLGQRIEAHVVLEVEAGPIDPAGLMSRIRLHCAEELSLQRMPRAVHVWPELPRLANGKTDKLRLAAHGA